LTHIKEDGKNGAQMRDVGDGVLDIPCAINPHKRAKRKNMAWSEAKNGKEGSKSRYVEDAVPYELSIARIFSPFEIVGQVKPFTNKYFHSPPQPDP